jgi:hypothetical protein
MDIEEWLAIGYKNGWVGPPVCVTHDGFPTTASEDEDGGDPCMHGLRLYETAEEKTDVENNHAPSQWRASNRGLTE